MRIIMNGALGRMGHMIDEAVSKKDNMEIVSYVDAHAEEHDNYHASLSTVCEEADIVIDFSNHASTKDLCDFCVEKKIPAIICTTGQTPEELEIIKAASEHIAVFHAGNTSVGIAVLCDLAKRAVAMFPDADVEIVEMHHNQKLDVPSGTALMLANAIKEVRTNATFNIGRHENGKRTKEEIGIHSVRMGNEVGTHEILINTGNECITIKHNAFSRAVFADGALKIAEFLVNVKSGLYNMDGFMKERA